MYSDIKHHAKSYIRQLIIQLEHMRRHRRRISTLSFPLPRLLFIRMILSIFFFHNEKPRRHIQQQILDESLHEQKFMKSKINIYLFRIENLSITSTI